ncbi:MAG: gliding motility protein GldL [Odoribacter sp.]|nr:gliding motility protein GldL [Odoribacter sp.]
MGKLFRSRAYKVIVGYIYGWGAAAVIIGALFKIMHYPGASYILSIGMIIEAAIFAISAFEPLVEHYDWARVFPELGNDKESLEKSGIGSRVDLRNQQMVSKGNIVEELAESEIEQLKESINKMIASANNFTAATASVPEFGEKVGNITVTLE